LNTKPHGIHVVLETGECKR